MSDIQDFLKGPFTVKNNNKESSQEDLSPVLPTKYGYTSEQFNEMRRNRARLSTEDFLTKYGQQGIKALNNELRLLGKQQSAQAIAPMYDSLASDVTDAAKDISLGTLNSLVDFATPIAGTINRDWGIATANASNTLNKFRENIGSESQKYTRDFYNATLALKDQEATRRMASRIDQGGDPIIERINKEFSNAADTIDTALYTGHWKEQGSLLMGDALAAYITARLGGAGLAAVPPAANLAKSLAKAKGIKGSIARGTPWALSMGIQEAGGSTGDQITNVMDIPQSKLYENSKEYRDRVADRYKEFQSKNPNAFLSSDPTVKVEAENEGIKYALDEAQKDLAVSSGLEVGAKVAPLAIGANFLTSKAFPFTKSKGVASAIGDGAKEMVEEVPVEVGSQVTSNLVNKDRINPSVHVLDDTGRAAGEAIVGTGVVGAHRAAIDPLLNSDEDALNKSNLEDTVSTADSNLSKSKEKDSLVDSSAGSDESQAKSLGFSGVNTPTESIPETQPFTDEPETGALDIASPSEIETASELTPLTDGDTSTKVSSENDSFEHSDTKSKVIPETQEENTSSINESSITFAKDTEEYKVFSKQENAVKLSKIPTKVDESGVVLSEQNGEWKPLKIKDIDPTTSSDKDIVVSSNNEDSSSDLVLKANQEDSFLSNEQDSNLNTSLALADKFQAVKDDPEQQETVTKIQSAYATLADKVDKNRSSYAKDTPLTAHQLEDEANRLTFIAHAYSNDLAITTLDNDVSNGLLTIDQAIQVLSNSYTNPSVESAMLDLAKGLGISVEKEDSSQEKLSNSESDFSEVTSRVSSDDSMESYSTDSSDIVRYTISNGKEKRRLEISLNKDNSGGKISLVESTPNGEKLHSKDISAEQVADIKAGKYSLNSFTHSVYKLDPSFKVVDENEVIQQAYLEISNPDTSPERREAIEQKVLKPRWLTVVENDDGSFDLVEKERDDVKGVFTNTFGKTFSSFFTPIKRAIRLWNFGSKASPLEGLLNLIGNEKELSNYFNSLNLSGSNKILSRILEGKDKGIKDIPDPTSSLGSQLRSALHKDGYIMKNLLPKLDEYLTYPEDMSKEAREKLKEIIAISLVHFIAGLGSRKHILTEEDLSSHGFLKDQDNLDQTYQGTMAPIAIQNLATTIRKFMGVAYNNDKSKDAPLLVEIEDLIGGLAGSAAKAAVEAGLVTINKVELKREVYSKKTGTTEPKGVTVGFFAPASMFDGASNRLFRQDADILEKLLDPNYKNEILYAPVKPGITVNHSGIPLTKRQIAVENYLNNVPHRLCMPMLGFLSQLGEKGLDLFSAPDTSDTGLFNKNHLTSELGRKISRSLGFDYARQAIANRLESMADLENMIVFYDNTVARNGRYYQKGSATFQGNKLSRALWVPGDKHKVNLTQNNGNDSKKLKAWKVTVAQNLGAGINKKNYTQFIKTVEDVLKFLKDPKYKSIVDAVKSDPNLDNFNDPEFVNKALVVDLNVMMDNFNEEFRSKGLGWNRANKIGTLNTLIECIRYNEARSDPSKLKNFESFVWLEIDGIADGPSNINSMFSVLYHNFSPEYIRNRAKTGMYLTGDTTTQSALDKNNINTNPLEPDNFNEVRGADQHTETAEQVTRFFLDRIIEINTNVNSSAINRAKSKYLIKAMQGLLTAFQAVGWLVPGSDISNLENITSVPNELPFVFEREISKVLTTIIPYGSQPRGTTAQTINLIVRALYEEVTSNLHRVAQDTNAGTYGYVKNFANKIKNGTVYVIDTETTDAKVGKAEVAQIAIKKLVNGKEDLKSKPTVIWIDLGDNPKFPEKLGKDSDIDNPIIPIYRSIKHGTDPEGRKLVSKEEALKHLKAIIGNKPILGHNINQFDLPVLEKFIGDKLPNESLDTLAISQIVRAGKVNNLDYLRKEYELDKNQQDDASAHLADFDVNSTIEYTTKHLLSLCDAFTKDRVPLERSWDQNVTPSFNGVRYEGLVGALEDLCSIAINPSGEFIVDDKIKTSKKHKNKFLFGLPSKFPTAARLRNSAYSLNPFTKNVREFTADAPKEPNEDIIQNFTITNEAIDRIVSTMTVLFGEATFSGAFRSLGVNAMKGSQFTMVVGGLESIVALAVDCSLGNPLKKTVLQSFRDKLKVNKFSPIWLLDSGVKAVIQKTKLRDQDKPVHKSKHGDDFNYYSRQEEVIPAGVSPSPLLTVALGDASMITYLAKLAKSKIGQIFDSANVPSWEGEHYTRLLNQCVALAQQQKVGTMLKKHLETLGDNLLKEGVASCEDPNRKITSPQEAVITVLQNLATGYGIDGKELPRHAKARTSDVNKTIQSYLTMLERDMGSFKTLDDRTPDFVLVKEPERTRAMIKEKMDHLYDQLVVFSDNERINREVLKETPQVFQHMSAMEAPYKSGRAPTEKEYYDLFNAINSEITEENRYKDFPEFAAAYLASKGAQKAEQQKITENYTESQLALWEEVRGESSVNKTRVMAPIHRDRVDALLQTKVPSPEERKQHTTKVLYKAVKHELTKLGKNKNILWRSIFNKLNQILPDLDNTEIELVSSKEDLPSHVQALMKGNTTYGYYVKEGSTHKIYVVDRSGKEKPNILDKKNLEVLVHEAIHAALATRIHAYFTNRSLLTGEQLHALENLEKLLDRFMEIPLESEVGVSDVVREFKAILEHYANNPEARLNEALAYILSNKGLFHALSQLEDKAQSISKDHWKEDETRLKSLLDYIKRQAEKVFNYLLGIVHGSVLSMPYKADLLKGALTSQKVDIENTPIQGFLKLFGMNTVVFLNAETRPLDPKDKNRSKAERDQRDQHRKDELDKLNIDGLKHEELSVFQRLSVKNPKGNIEQNIKQKAIYKKFRWLTRNNFNIGKLDKEVKKELTKVQNYEDALTAYLNDLGIQDSYDIASIALDLQAADTLTSKQRADLGVLFTKLSSKLTKDFFLEDPAKATTKEKELSKFLYKLFTGKIPLQTSLPLDSYPESLKQNFELPALFFAFALNNQKLFKNIKDIKVKSIQGITIHGNTFKGFIDQLSKKLQEYFDEPLNVSNVNTYTLDQIRKQQENGLGSKLPFWFTFGQSLTKFSNKVALQSFVTTFNLLSKIIRRKPLFSDEAIKEITRDPLLLKTYLGEVTRSFLNKRNSTMFIQFIAPMLGRLPSNSKFHDMRKRLKGEDDRSRKFNLDNLPEILIGKFKNHKITLKDREFFDMFLGQTDISVLSDNLKIAEEALTDKTKLDQLIKEFENKLLKSDKKVGALYIQKCKELANYLSNNDIENGGRAASHFMLRNAEAIAHLWGVYHLTWEPDADTIASIDKLTTFYCLSYMTDGDRAKMADFYSSDRDAVNHLIKELKAVNDAEKKRIEATSQQETEEKTFRNAMYKYNRTKGWRPAGAQPRGHYFIAPKRLAQEFISRGYKVLGDYNNSNVDPSEPMVTLYTEYPHERERQEGILQTITQTAFGYQIEENSSGEANGIKIFNTKNSKNIAKITATYDTESSGNRVIPIIDPVGRIVGYERSIPPEDRQYLDRHRDLFTGLAQYYERQTREASASETNTQLVELCWDDWRNASEEERKEFIDVYASTDPDVVDARNRFDLKTQKKIFDKFGDNHFYVKKDVLPTVIGYYKLSITDLWDHKTFLPKQAETIITKMLEAFLGPRARFHMGNIENVVKGVVSYAKETIVTRSVLVPALNFSCNMIMLNMIFGIPWVEIYRRFKQSFNETEQYNRYQRRLLEINTELLDASKSRKAELEKEKFDIQTHIKNMTINFMLESGEYSTISKMGKQFENFDMLKMNFGDHLDTIAEKLPPALKTFGSNLLLTRNSELFQMMNKATTYGDWLAKCIGFTYLSEKSKYNPTPYSQELARDLVSTLYVDYDQFGGKESEYLASMGLTWFMAYKYRMIPAAILSICLNPARTLIGSALIASGTPFSTPLLDNVVSKAADGSLSWAVGPSNIIRGILMHPLNWLFGVRLV